MRKKYNTPRALDIAPETKKINSVEKYIDLYKSKVDGLIISKDVLDNQSIYRGGIDTILKTSPTIESFKEKLLQKNKPKQEKLTSIEIDSGISAEKIKSSYNVSKELGELIGEFNNRFKQVLNMEKAQDMLKQVGLADDYKKVAMA